jgi:hypothetical protein
MPARARHTLAEQLKLRQSRIHASYSASGFALCSPRGASITEDWPPVVQELRHKATINRNDSQQPLAKPIFDSAIS